MVLSLPAAATFVTNMHLDVLTLNKISTEVKTVEVRALEKDFDSN